MKFKSLFELAKTAFGNWTDDYAPSMGAALAYYTVFSIAPLLAFGMVLAIGFLLIVSLVVGAGIAAWGKY